MSTLPWLEPDHLWFPDPRTALDDPDGLLAIGGDLSVDRLTLAYRNGIFPWFSEDQPILWWSPDPRCVLFPEELHISRSLRKTLNKERFTVTINKAFTEVIDGCATSREEGTWITPDMRLAYLRLHALGMAHSFETWNDEGELVGGLYGVAMGRCFFGESMFTRETDASKVAFVHAVRQLQAWEYALLDCQVENPHLRSLGATLISRERFLTILKQNIDAMPRQLAWHMEWRWPDGSSS
ncbi:leucyl/phenylalanyl-tRNA--protein transferase [Marinobacteraceae bacterium S3BR75-40.1]